jgi:hypothetical protein
LVIVRDPCGGALLGVTWARSESDFLEGLKRYGMTGRWFAVTDENGDTHAIRSAWLIDDTRGMIGFTTDKGLNGLNVTRVSRGVYALSDGITTIRATSNDPTVP